MEKEEEEVSFRSWTFEALDAVELPRWERSEQVWFHVSLMTPDACSLETVADDK